MSAPLLEVRDVAAEYGDVPALWGISLDVGQGEVVALVGPNGAGKTTLMRTIAGLHHPSRGAVLLDGEPLQRLAAHQIVARGMVLVPEGRHLFGELTVLENLLLGAHAAPARRRREQTLGQVYEIFPLLAERQHQAASTLSGGQQQMLAIGRALMGTPRLLLLDEPSLGLAPIVVRDIYARLPSILAQGIALAIVEQDIAQALKAAQHAYCLQEGRVALAGASAALTREAIANAYFGV